MGPLWDWNLAFGNANGKQGYLPEHWLWPQLDDQQYSWFRRLFEDPDFGQRYVDRWAQLRTNVLATSNIIARVDYYTNLLNEAQVRNYDRWPILGRQVWPQYAWGNTYAEEVEFMKDWIVKRLAWIDAQFVAPPSFSLSSLGGEGSIQLTLTAPKGDIYYTLDGSDPRQVPDFRAVLIDQFRLLQTRIDDTIQSSSIRTPPSYANAKLDPTRAGVIADEELADLNAWLEKRWNATPRDTALLMKLIRHLPAG